MNFWVLLFSFAPWIAFKIIVSLPLASPLVMVKVGITVAAALCALQAWTDKVRGLIFWGSLSFFIFAVVMVIGLSNRWVMMHLGILAQIQLAGLTWGSILAGRPFTIAYARLHTPPERWNDPAFLRGNRFITAVWGGGFLIGLAVALLRFYRAPVAGAILECVDDGSLLGALLFTSLYTKRKKAAAAPQSVEPPPVVSN